MKEKELKQKITYREGQTDYQIEAQKRCRWCWLLLLLLLLPLVLLIPIRKDIKIVLVDSYNNSLVTGRPVYFEYARRDMIDFDSLNFFTNYYPVPSPTMVDTTDENGVAHFRVEYTLYQWATFFLRKQDIAKAYALDSCYGADSTYRFFDLKAEKETILYLKPALLDVVFTVVDADDNNEPLPEAKVLIRNKDYALLDSVLTDEAGKTPVLKIPKCSAIEVIASKYGWYNDTLRGEAGELYPEEDTLFLKQEKAIVKFFVKDVNTKKAIVGAHGQLFFEKNPNKQIGEDAVTNTNGIGKGVFEEVHKIQKMRIDINKKRELKFYNDSSTLDNIGYLSVENWNKRSDEQKIIYLSPQPSPIVFYDVDCKTKTGLPNVENKVTIKKTNGSTVGPETIISGADGSFSISAAMGDEVSIEAKSRNECPDEYEPNTTAIVNVPFERLTKDANLRKIPLCRKTAPKVKFRNVDADTGRGVAGVLNTVIVQGGGTFTITSGSGGWFEIDKLYDCQVISIRADGSPVDYGQNTTKVNSKLYGSLMPPTAQSERDIPLEEEPKYEVCIYNFNSAADEIVDVYVNGTKLGRVSHDSDKDLRTCFKTKFKKNEYNTILIKYVRDGKASNTGTKLIINPGGKTMTFSGNNDDHIFRYNPTTGVLRKE